jgi:hypothetical protein
MSKAKKTQVQLGDITLEGYMAADDTYYMSTRYVGECIGMSPRTYGMHLGKKRKKSQAKKTPQNTTSVSNTKGDSQAIIPQPRTIKVEGSVQQITGTTLEFVSEFWFLQAEKGNVIAKALCKALMIESLQRRFDKAFGKAVSEEEYNAQLQQRWERLQARKGWTGTFKSLLIRDKMYYKPGTKEIAEHVKEAYASTTVKVNWELFGVRDFNGDRDNMTREQQIQIERFERTLVAYSKKHPKKNGFEVIEDVLALPIW